MKQYLSSQSFEDEVAVIAKKLVQMFLSRDETYKQLTESDKMRSILEVQLLQERINPHMLYNSLTVLRVHSVKNKDNKTTKLLDSLTAYYRSALTRDNVLERIENELIMLTEYVSVINQITGSRYKVISEVQENVKDCYILRHILQPLAENAIKHGFLGRAEGTIIIRANMENEKILFTVFDDGSGINDTQIDEILTLQYTVIKGGFGLQNLIRRIKLYYEKSGDIQISSEIGKGTTIRLCIPKIDL